MSYLARIADCNNHDPARYRVFRIAGQDAGKVAHVFAEHLREFDEVFTVTPREVGLVPTLETLDARCEAVDEVFCELARRGLVRGWRAERHKIAPSWEAPPLLLVERAAVPCLGAGGFSVHLNGYVRVGEAIHMWIGRRSRSKSNSPGKLDQLVAGGQPAHLGLLENLLKECAEEAAIPRSLAVRARATGHISYLYDSADGHRPDVVYTYDLELPADFRPTNTDGEVASFELWPLAEVAAAVRDTRRFKYNAALVIIDFLLRHGHIDRRHPDHVALAAGLRCGRRARPSAG